MYTSTPPHYIYISPSLPHVQANYIDISYSKCIKHIGVFFDSNISLHRHEQYHIKYISTPTLYDLSEIPLSNVIIIASSFILPHFDYCNSILLNLPGYQINRLQLAQNSVARCIFKMDISCISIRFSRISIKSKLTQIPNYFQEPPAPV